MGYLLPLLSIEGNGRPLMFIGLSVKVLWLVTLVTVITECYFEIEIVIKWYLIGDHPSWYIYIISIITFIFYSKSKEDLLPLTT